LRSLRAHIKDNMKPILNYFSASWAEIRKVTWPTRPQLIKLTIVVIVFATVLAFTLGAIDLGFSTLLKMIVTKG
jgi:preprotein translocase subunit SecE